MFFIGNGYLIVLLFHCVTVVYPQMDVILRGPEPGANPHKELPTISDTSSVSIDSSPFSSEIFKFHNINSDMEKIGQQIDSEINKHFDVLHRETVQGPSQITKAISDFDSSDADEENPFLDLLKFIGNSLPYTPKGSKVSSSSVLNSNEATDQNEEPLRVYTVIRINDDDDVIPFEDNIIASRGDVVRNESGNADLEGPFVQGFLKGFVDAMKEMVDLLRNTTGISYIGEVNNQTQTDKPVDIEIKDHGKTYEIPPDAYVERSKPDMVNITWKSGIESLNNSLSMNIHKDENGVVVFHHIRLRIVEGNGLQEYDKEDSIRLEGKKNNSAEINLADGVGLKIPHPDSLDVVLIEKREKFSAQWMAVSIALLGLIVTGLVLLLSYILHTKNRYNSRKDSMFKEPIA